MDHMLWRFSAGLSLLVPVFLLGFVATASAQTAENDPAATPRERTALAASFATERLAVWQQRLNLQDWHVSIVVARTAELKPKTLGNIHWDLPKKTAIIRVLDPADYHLPFPQALEDIEFTVVHELIHLGFAPVVNDLQRSDANRREEEHAVNHLAEALLKLDRAK